MKTVTNPTSEIRHAKHALRFNPVFVGLCTLCFARDRQAPPHEPAVVTLQGALLSADGMKPEGEKLKFPAIRLTKPISVPEDEPRDWPAEKNVVLLHMALDEKNMAAFKRLKGKTVEVTGRLFHSDNGNHQTSVLLFPVSISPIK